MTHREVRVTEQFFSRLDELLPAERPGDGRPSATDFLLYDLPNVIESLADGYDRVTMPSGYDGHTRVLVATGLLTVAFVVYVRLSGADVVEVFYVDID